MASNYIDIVVVKHKIGGEILSYKAPAWKLHVGDEVMCGLDRGVVVSIMTEENKPEKLREHLDAFGRINSFPKVSSRVHYDKLEYDEEDEA